MLRLATGHLEDGDRPKYPHRITGAKVGIFVAIFCSFLALSNPTLPPQVQVNPFDDIVPREVIAQEVEKGKKKKKSKAKAHKVTDSTNKIETQQLLFYKYIN